MQFKFFIFLSRHYCFQFLFYIAFSLRKQREHFQRGWGFSTWSLFRSSKVSVYDPVWFHAASVGEVLGIIPVVKEFKKKYPDCKIVLTTTSKTGKEEIQKTNLVDFSAILPFDHVFSVNRVVNLINPRAVIFSETEIWPQLILTLNRKKVPIFIVNGRISKYSYPKYSRFKSFFAPLLNCFYKICVQSETDKFRFTNLGVEESKVRVLGSSKYDKENSIKEIKDIELLAKSAGINFSHPCFVAGSVREGEDQMIVQAYLQAREDVPGLQMIIAPKTSRAVSGCE